MPSDNAPVPRHVGNGPKGRPLDSASVLPARPRSAGSKRQSQQQAAAWNTEGHTTGEHHRPPARRPAHLCGRLCSSTRPAPRSSRRLPHGHRGRTHRRGALYLTRRLARSLPPIERDAAFSFPPVHPSRRRSSTRRKTRHRVPGRVQQIGGLPMGATQIVDGVEVRHRLTVRRAIASKCEANASPHQTDQRRRI
jgi:hypothetical protein